MLPVKAERTAQAADNQNQGNQEEQEGTSCRKSRLAAYQNLPTGGLTIHYVVLILGGTVYEVETSAFK